MKETKQTKNRKHEKSFYIKKDNKSKIEQLEISGHFLKEKKENKGKIESK